MFCVWGGRSGRVPRVEEGRGDAGLDALRRATKSPGEARRACWPLTDDTRRHPGGADDTNTNIVETCFQFSINPFSISHAAFLYTASVLITNHFSATRYFEFHFVFFLLV